MTETPKPKAKRTQTRLPKLPDGYHYDVHIIGPVTAEIYPFADGWRAHSTLPPGDHDGGRERYADHASLSAALGQVVEAVRKFASYEAERVKVEKAGQGVLDVFGKARDADEPDDDPDSPHLGGPARQIHVTPSDPGE